MQLTCRSLHTCARRERVCTYVGVTDLQSFGGRRWSLELQGEHAGAEGQVVELQPLTEDSEEEGSLGQRVGGHLRLTAGGHLALLTLPSKQRTMTSGRHNATSEKYIWTLKFFFVN